MKRKGLSKKTRFAVLARDNFTCCYCGKTAKEAELRVDHIHPVCQGGDNHQTNLITACFDCNAGKSGSTIQQVAPTEQDRLRLALEAEKREQDRRAVEKIRLEDERLTEQVGEMFCEITNRDAVSMDTLHVLISYVRQHGPEVVAEWIKIASRKFQPWHNDRSIGRYISGIRRKVMQPLDTPDIVCHCHTSECKDA